MADRKITALTELTTPVATDVFPIIDVSESANANKNKKIQLTTILRGIPNGSVSAPSVGFIDDTGTTGLFRVTDDEIGISCNQTQIASFATTGLKLGSGTAAAQLHLFSTDTTDQVIIENTDTGADTAPDLVLFRNSTSPADNDNLGNLIFRGKDDNGDSVEYASVVAQIADATNSSEDGILDLMSTAAGTLASRIRLKSEFVGIHEADPTFPLHLTTADTTSGFCIESTLDSSASSADILLFHRRGSDGAGQDNDLLSSISFQGKNDAGTPEEVVYAMLETKIIDASDASEDGQINLKSMVAGSLTTVLTVDSNGATVVGNIVVSGTVDGVDIATRDTLFGGLTSSSGVLTNGVTATTQSASDNSTKVATTAYTDTAISNLVDSSPGTLNTLNELAAALGDDANFSTTVTNSIATKMPLAGGSFTGDVTFTGDSANIIFDKSDDALEFADNAKAVFGAGADLSLLHDGTDSFIKNITGNLHIRPKAGEEGIKLFPDGSVYLYYDNALKFQTTAWGSIVTGTLQVSNLEATSGYLHVKADNQPVKIGAGSDLSLLHDGTDSKITNITGNLLIEPKSGETGIKVIPDGAVELYHDNVKRCETSADGLNLTDGRLFLYNSTIPHIRINKTSGDTASTRFILGIATGTDSFITGATQNTCCIKTGGNNMMFGIGTDKKLEINSNGVNLPDNSKLQLGDSQDLSLVHDGAGSKIENSTGSLNINTVSSEIWFSKGTSEYLARFITDGAVELYHNGYKKLETTSSGITVTGSVTTQDMNMSNLNGTANEVDGSKGSWTLQEGADDLFIINRVSGKKYKFNLTEIS